MTDQFLWFQVSNEQLQQQLEYTILKPDCHSWWVSKMQSGCQDTSEERYTIKMCFKLEKMPQKRMECFRLLFDHLAWIEHEFLSGIRDSRKAEGLWGMMKDVGGKRKSIHQSGLARGFELWLLCWDFKGVSGRDSVGRGKHSSNRVSGISSRTMHQSTTPSLTETIWPRWASRQFLSLLAPCNFWLFRKLRGCRYETIEEIKEAVTKVIDTLTQEDLHGAFQKLYYQ